MTPRESLWTKLWAGTSSEELCLLYREAQVLPSAERGLPVSCWYLCQLKSEGKGTASAQILGVSIQAQSTVVVW